MKPSFPLRPRAGHRRPAGVFAALGILMIGLPCGAVGQSVVMRELDRFLRQHLAEIPIPGFSAVVVQGDEIIFARGYGVEVVGGNRPLTSRSPIAIGSLTKSFTAVAIMQLVERGLVDLDTPVVEYISWFRTADRRGAEITLRMLLTNTSGIPSQDRWMFSRDTAEAAIEAEVRGLSSVALTRTPGQSFEYANENWSVAGVVLSEVTGMAYSAYMQRYVFDPLQMRQATTALADFARKGVLRGHYVGPDRVEPAGPRFLAVGLPAGSELRASAEDMGNYLIMLLNGGLFHGTRLLQQESVATLLEPAIRFTATMPEMGVYGEEAAYAMGWALVQADGRLIIQHGGDALVMGSWAIIDPNARTAACVLYNGPGLDPYRYKSKLWLVNNLLHIVAGEPISDYGLPQEGDPTANDFDLPPSSFAEYVGSYVSADGFRMRIAEDTAQERLLLNMQAGDIRYAYELDFASATSVVLRNLSGGSVASFTMTPDGQVTGLRGGLPGGVYRKRSVEELAGSREIESPDGTVVFIVPRAWSVQWTGNRFEAHDSADPATTLRGIARRSSSAGPAFGLALPGDDATDVYERTETVGRYVWREVMWSDGVGDDRRQHLTAVTADAGVEFEIALGCRYGQLTTAIRQVVFPLMEDVDLRRR
jgi:CubicO group peptidase (beta-lactamase class C family)